MRLQIICKDRLGMTLDILTILAKYRINMSAGEYGQDKEQDCIYINAPSLSLELWHRLLPELKAVDGVRDVHPIPLMPSERRHFELNTLLSSLADPVMSVDLEGRIIVANSAAEEALKLGGRDSKGVSLAPMVENLALVDVINSLEDSLYGMRMVIRGESYLADIFPVMIPIPKVGSSLSGAVISLHAAHRVGQHMYAVQKQDFRGFRDIVHRSDKMQQLLKQARRMAMLDAPLLIVGETGTGKELVARACHQAGPRREAPFMVLNCAALPESAAESELFGYAPGAFEGAQPEGKMGLLELSAGGTLFLDEVGEMAPYLQQKLLRFLQDGSFRRVGSDEELRVDVRIICATQKDLLILCREGQFREDLYFRLNVLNLYLPPLRERRAEIPLLAEHFVVQAAHQLGCTPPRLAPQTLAQLQDYDWPGNVRQLQNALFRAVSVLEGDTVQPEHLRLPATDEPEGYYDLEFEGTLEEAMRRYEAGLLKRLYPAYPSTRQLAKRLGLSHTAIANKLRQYGIGRKRKE